MTLRGAICLLIAAASPCLGNGTDAAYGDPSRIWELVMLNGTPFEGRATLQFTAGGGVAGQAPCNRYSGAVTESYPGFGTGAIAATRMACPDMAAEAAFLEALSVMDAAEIGDETMTLTGPEDRSMRFRPAD